MILEAQPEGREPPDRARALEFALCFCPGCSKRLEQRRCQLVCTACGYAMTCSDFY